MLRFTPVDSSSPARCVSRGATSIRQQKCSAPRGADPVPTVRLVTPNGAEAARVAAAAGVDLAGNGLAGTALSFALRQ